MIRIAMRLILVKAVCFLDGFGPLAEQGRRLSLTYPWQKFGLGVILHCLPSSGIAATFLDGGTTAHSRFKIPIDIEVDSTCNFPAQSPLASRNCFGLLG